MPISNGSFIEPLTASDGIHETATTRPTCLVMAAVSALFGPWDRAEAGVARWCHPHHRDAWSRRRHAAVDRAKMRPVTISVFLADDNLIVRAGVRALLGREPDVDVV